MKFSRREGPFTTEIHGGLLSARRHTPEEGGGMNGANFHTRAVSEPLFILPLAEMPWFVMHGEGLYAQNARDALTPLYRGDDAALLLGCITGLLTTVESQRLSSQRHRKYGHVATVLILAGFLLIKPIAISGLISAPEVRLLTTVDAARPALSNPAPTAPVSPPVRPSYEKGLRTDLPVPAPQPPVATNDNGWSLPQNVRAELPGKLSKAAARGLFTVPLSSGHARTIYVFADPACPNCQRMERHFETAAGTVNVVIFPVTIEGREASLKALTPVMALPEAKRPAAWKQLFSADAGIGVPGAAPAAPAVTTETQAETARGAIGVNEVAFRAYRLPGTPWTISDDGRYVPQSVLSSPAALMDFLNGGEHGGQ